MIAQAGTTTTTMLSTIDAIQVERATTLYRTYGDQWGQTIAMLKAMSMIEAVGNITGAHYEEDRYDAIITVKSNVADPGAGNSVTFLIDLSEVDSTTGTAEAYPNVGDYIYDPITMVRAQIIDKSANATDVTLIARPLKTTDNIGPLTGGTTKFAIYSNAYAEGTVQPEGRQSFWTKRDWQKQIIKTTAEVTGTAQNMKLYPTKDSDGNVVGYWDPVLARQAEYRHNKALVGAMILGIDANNTLVTDGTVGMLSTFQSRATNHDYGASMDVTDLYDALETAAANNISKDLVGLFGFRPYKQLEQAALTYTANTNIATSFRHVAELMFGKSGAAAESMATTLGFSNLVFNGYNMNWQKLDWTHDPKMFNLAATSTFPNYAFIFPAAGGMDAQGNAKKHIGMKHISQGGRNRLSKVWADGGSSYREIGPTDKALYYYLSEVAFDWFAIEQCILMYT